MKATIASFIFIMVLASAVKSQPLNTLTAKEKADGWKLLFDGKTTKGWHTFKQKGIGKAWNVQEGALHLDVSTKDGRGDIVSDAAYENYHFTFDWKVAPKANSGIIFLVQDREPYQATWHTGPEYQIIDNVNYPDKLNPIQLSASLYDLIACPAEFVKPAGDWNTGAIIINKGSLKFYVNGKLAVKTTLWNDEWKKMVEGSKFINEKDFARSPVGHLAIQDHGGEVWLRNLKIKTL